MALAPVPTTATRLPVRSTSWRHCAEWKAGPVKVSAPGMSGDDRVRELAHGRDHQVGLERLAVAGGDPPAAPRVVVLRGLDLHAGADQVEQPGLARGAAEVVEDLGLGAVAAAPLRVRRPGPGVQRRRHVAGRAGVGVVPPHPAHVVGALEDRDVVDTDPAQRLRDAETAEAGADDHHARRAHGATLEQSTGHGAAVSSTAPRPVTSSRLSRRHSMKTSGSGTAAVSMLMPIRQLSR